MYTHKVLNGVGVALAIQLLAWHSEIDTSKQKANQITWTCLRQAKGRSKRQTIRNSKQDHEHGDMLHEVEVLFTEFRIEEMNKL